MASATKANKARKTNRELKQSWLGEERLRFQWRRIVINAKSFAQVSTCASILFEVLTDPQEIRYQQ